MVGKNEEPAVYKSLAKIFTAQQIDKMIENEPSAALDDISKDKVKLLLCYAISHIYA